MGGSAGTEPGPPAAGTAVFCKKHLQFVMNILQLILGGLGAALLYDNFSQEDEEGAGPAYVPDENWLELEAAAANGAAIGKLYDSEYIRAGGRVDQHWGDVVPNKSYLGREAELRGHYLDPITLWLNPQDGKHYILSGHSRTEAFHQLCRQAKLAEGKGFCAIPAKIIEGISLEEAQRIAMESNTLSTKETDLERGAYFRRIREWEGLSYAQLKAQAQRSEGRNANTILAFSYLNPSGKAWAALEALDTGQDTSRAVINNVARWIGGARAKYPQLTNQHENELYDWLVLHKGYGTSAGQLNSELDFLNRLHSIINRRTEFGVFDQDKPLNVLNTLSKSPTEATYDAQLAAAKADVNSLEKELKEKITDLNRRDATEEQIRQLIAPIEADLRRAVVAHQNLVLAKGNILKAAQGERGLFDDIGGLVRRRTARMSYYQM